MQLLQVTKQYVQDAAGLFTGKENERSLIAHKCLFGLHKYYEEAFIIIENKELIQKTPYKINRCKYQFSNAIVFSGSNSFICNCTKFDAKEFQLCPHIIAVMFAEELQLCQTQATGTGNDYLRDISSFI